MKPVKQFLDFDKLTKLMEMTTSDHENEALTALRKANAILARNNQSWSELLGGKVLKPFDGIPDLSQPNRHTPHTDPQIDTWFHQLLNGPRQVTTSFRAYVEDVHKWWIEQKFLTDKQFNAIKKAAMR